MPKSKFFRVAVEGATVDGRTIDRKWIEEMAATYNRATYAARVNLEHYRGAFPLGNNSPFGAYGDILAVKAETVTLNIGGKDEQRLALYAEIDALEPLVDLNKKGQKLYTSVEVNPSFADTGKAYLMGVAVTDSPASLGTEMLQFCATQGDKSPLARFKQQPGNYFSEATETVIELVDEGDKSVTDTGLMASVKAFFDRLNSTAAPAPAPVTTPTTTEPAPPANADFAALGVLMTSVVGSVDKLANAVSAASDTNNARFAKIEAQLANTPDQNHRPRQFATGGDDAVKTDC